MILILLAVLFGIGAIVAAVSGDWFATGVAAVMTLITLFSFVLGKRGARPASSGKTFWDGLGGGWKKNG